MKITRELKIGLYAAVMLACLYLGVNYLKGKDVFSSDRTYYTQYDQVSGLQKSSPVLLKGVKIGAVTDISIDHANMNRVIVTVNIKRSYKIPVDSRLKLKNGLLTGSSIEVVPGTSANYFERGATIPSEAQSDLLEYASVGLEDVIGEFKRIVNSLDETTTTINGILSENAGNLKGTMANLNSMTRQLADARIGDMIRDLGTFTTMLKSNSAKFGNIVADIDEVTSGLAEIDLRQTVDGLNGSIAGLNGVLAKISDGEGSLGRLVDDPALYDSLTAASANLAALLEDLRENPKRYVHFSLFGKKNKKQ